ncbi:MAG: UDP-N-acetylmuramoyl-L-alanyl-D-glutamate--2,6-diaminopimelate ligase [Bacteroidia bacterium]|nr:UDP-N-acetylmuramoyl-L-alanyl-D-glutamate--2,6-diaminopimelate ligase [Bacteroidia bacterium]
MKKLEDILKNITTEKIAGDVSRNINRIAFDSRSVTENDLFVAVPGTQSDGHNFIGMAIEKGAGVIVCEKIPAALLPSVTYIMVKDSSYALGFLASDYFDNPSSKLKLIGVTGTNGKTTTATLSYRLAKKLGYKSGLLSTVRNYIGNREIAATHTTPDAVKINSLINDMVVEGCEYCFIEVSSHAIVQNRIAGLKFTGGIFTNITHDHLDYHKTFDEYIKAKKIFFDHLDENAFALANIDDRNGKVMLQNTKAQKYSYSLKSYSDFKCKILESHFDGMLLNIDGNEVWTKLIGGFNAYNILAVYSTAVLLKHQKEEVLTILSDLVTVDGRFEYIRSKNGITAIVDYAHTPDALINVLSTINEIRAGLGRLITVVGAGGDRDKTKRPVMAKAASELSDKVILTSDNPRSENPETILEDMYAGIEAHNRKKVVKITDRKEAIHAACIMADVYDILLIAGKGHENYQEIKGVKHPFDDKKVVREIFNEIG